MIAANELRIGNYFIDDTGKYLMYVSGIITEPSGYERIFYRCVDNDAKEAVFTIGVEPIELTPEILEKCGFESYKDDLDGVMTYYNYGEFRITYWKGAYWNYLGKEIKYLHQVQNLVFAIAEQELSVQI